VGLKLGHLKAARVALSLVFFGLTALVFLDLGAVSPPAFTGGILYLQFVPSLLAFVHGAALGAAGWLFVAALTVLFGRVYCSTVCPLGTLQDAIGFVAGKRRRFHLRPGGTLRYAIVAVTALLLIGGSGLLLNLLDPFSAFGRILVDLVRPAVIVTNNIVAAALEQFGHYAVSRKQWAVLTPLAVGVAATTLVVVGWLAARRGRLYCNTVCPVGTLLGLVSRVSWLRLGINHDRCSKCRRCERVCKAGCIDLENMKVDTGRCVACCNCLAACPEGAVHFENRWRRVPPVRADQGRRDFFLHSGVSLLGLAGLVETNATVLQSKPTTIPEAVTGPVSPPGSVSIERFTSICTACHLCVSVCPSRVLSPSVFEFGPSGMMQPRLNFRASYCNYECTLCTQVCPTGAILPLAPEEKKRTQLGVARFIKENCIVLTDNTNCGACSEHCPTKAVRMVPYPNLLNRPLVIPEVHADYCVGCGACEYACPTKPFKAICVDGNPVHGKSKKPEPRALEIKIDETGDFPF
jgi:ferredoxin